MGMKRTNSRGQKRLEASKKRKKEKTLKIVDVHFFDQGRKHDQKKI